MTLLDFDLKTGHDVSRLNAQAAQLLASRAFRSVEECILDWFSANPSPFSSAAKASPPESFALSGWDAVYADVAKRIATGKETAALGIDLTGHWEGDSPGFEVALYDCGSFPFFDTAVEAIAQLASNYGAPWQGSFAELDNSLRSLPDNALYQAIVKYPERYWGVAGDRIPEGYTGYLAAVWLLYARICLELEKSLTAFGMPKGLVAIVGQNDFGPWFGTAFEIRESEKLQGAAAEFEQTRQTAQAAKFQSLVIKEIAETREMYRLLHMFPFYRFISRRKFADQLTGQLQIMARARGISTAGIDRNIDKKTFEAFLRTYVELRNPSSVDDALAGRHTDALHQSWLEIASRKNFELGSSSFSLFEIHLSWALKSGGPILVDRWAHAKPYLA